MTEAVSSSGERNKGFLKAIAPAAAAAAAIKELFSSGGSCVGELWFIRFLVWLLISLMFSSFVLEFTDNRVCGGLDAIKDVTDDEPDDIVDAVDDGRTGCGGSGCCGSNAVIDVGVFGSTISVIFAGLDVVLEADEIATGFKEEIQALISGFKSAIGKGGFKGVILEMSGVKVVAAVIERGLFEAKDDAIIDGGDSTIEGGAMSSSKFPFIMVPLLLLFRLLLNWHFLEVI